MKKELIAEIDGYGEIVKEIEVLRKYGHDYSEDRGSVRDCIDRLHPARMKLRVADVFQETKTAKTLRLVPAEGGCPPFIAGQYLALYPEIGRVRTGRAYSISSPPNHAGYYDITVRRVKAGFVSNYLMDDVKTGDTLTTSGPSGNFYYNPIFHDTAMVLIAGGSGITPFMSMIREIAERGLRRTVYLIYGNKKENDIIFHDELLGIASRFSNIKYYTVLESPGKSYKGLQGYIGADIIKDTLKDLSGKTFYLCGPAAMYDFCVPQLESLDIPRKKIRREMYGAPSSISAHDGWPEGIKETDTFTVKIDGAGPIKARAGEPLLNSMERHGIAVPSLCRSGECSLCRVKLLSGRVFQPRGVLLRKSDKKYGYIHSCAAYPLEDLEISR